MKLPEWLNRLVHGGTREFSASERSILDAVIASLPLADGQLLQQQIAQVSLVQRPQPGRMTICYYPKPSDVPAFGFQDYEVCLAKVFIRSAGGKPGQVKIMLHLGRLQSMEGRLPSVPVAAADCEITLWPALASNFPEAADRLEHPRTGNAQ